MAQRGDTEEFHEQLHQSVLVDAEAEGVWVEDSFFERFTVELIDAGEIETADRAFYAGRKGVRVDGYGGSPMSSGDGTLTILLLDFHPESEIGSLTRTEMEGAFKRGARFVSKALDPLFRRQLEESSPAFGLADTIAASWDQITRVRTILMSNRRLSSRVDGIEGGEVDGKPLIHSVWDIERLGDYVVAGRGREEMSIDFEEEFGQGIPLLSANVESASYESYLAVIPGEQLAKIYDRWGARLLEQNVRVFLQARGKVNKAIKGTLEGEPSMFFAYNNGLTATAESIKVNTREGLTQMASISNLQIVNGGQTTASIHKAFRDGYDLSRVFVQVKLSVVDALTSESIVPRISEYANSQNRVSAADFFSNHPFHVRMEEISRRLYAPSPEDAFRGSKWFYERARGQYQDDRGKLTPAKRKKFDLEFPRNQVFSKTDLAKFEGAWRGAPHVVSKGAQKNFADFASLIGRKWEDNSDQFNEKFFRDLVAKAIVFRSVERLVSRQDWYEGGYRANIVAYAIAKLASDARELGKHIDLNAIWKAQEISPVLEKALGLSSFHAHQILLDTPPSHRNVTEWAKQEACWERFSGAEISWSQEFMESLISGQKEAAIARAAEKAQEIDASIEVQTMVVQAGAEFWRQILTWGSARNLLTKKESDILAICRALPEKLPTEKQSAVAMKSLQRLREEGCRIGMDVL